MDMRATVPVSWDSMGQGAWPIEALLRGDVLTLFERYVRIRLSSGTIPLEPGRGDAHSLYGDATVESLFGVLAPRVDHLLRGASPSYGYIRVYTQGSDLAPHVDRHGCDFTLTIALCGSLAGIGWPIHARMLNGKDVEYEQQPGDGLLLRGREVRHWREPLATGWAAYAFLHWVDEGRGAARFDGRPGLGFGSSR